MNLLDLFRGIRPELEDAVIDTREMVPDVAISGDEHPYDGSLSLTDVDKHSAVWQKIKQHYEHRLNALRIRNDGDLTPEQTSRLRGQIKECKVLLGLDKASPGEVAQD